jgi:hypothetical protein
MANPTSGVADRVGPFVAGSSWSELAAVAQELGLRVVPEAEQQGNYDRQRCEGLKAAAKEFFYDYEGSASLVLQRTGESDAIPDFVEYIYGWLAHDRLCGLVFFGLSSEAGTRAQIDEHEKLFREQADEIAEALARKYPRSVESIVNFFHFESYALPPQVSGGDEHSVFAGFEQLVRTAEDNETRTTIEQHYCGPRVVRAAKTKPAPDNAAAASASDFVRRIYCNDEWFAVYDRKVEHYVRTIESLHLFTSLVYLSRREMDDIGRRLNGERSAWLAAETRKKIHAWKESLRQADEAKQQRIARLTAIL